MSEYSIRCYLLTYALHRTVSNFDIPRGEILFLKYGSNVRRIIDILKRLAEEAIHIHDVESGAANISKEFETLLRLKDLDFKTSLSSNIFTVRPNNLVERVGVLTIPTAYLFKALVVSVFRQTLAQQHKNFTMLTAHPSLATAAGWWFEHYAHVRLSDVTRQHILMVFQTHPPFLLPSVCYQAQLSFEKSSHHLIFIGGHGSPTLRALMASFVSGT